MRNKKAKVIQSEPGRCYVIMQLGFEYNDEINYRPDTGGGDPLKVFTDLGMANSYCEHMNIKAMRDCINDFGGLASYFYSVDDIDSTGKLESILNKLGVSTEHGSGSNATLTDEQVKSILDNSSLRFYTVESVELGNPTDVYGAVLKEKTI